MSEIEQLDLNAIEELCAAARVDMLGGMFCTAENEAQGGVWFPDGDLCAIVEDNLGTGYFWPVKLAELFARSPILIPALVARVRELEAWQEEALSLIHI